LDIEQITLQEQAQIGELYMLAPGEMEKIVIPKAFLDKVENGEITVSVEKVGA